jgi:RNA polymerase sigma factor (sigma-70 family)
VATGVLGELPWAVAPAPNLNAWWLRSQARRLGDLLGVRIGGRRTPAGGLNASEDFEALYLAMADRLLVFLGRKTADPEIAADLWAETWARAYEGRERFRGDVQAEKEAWVLGIARNVLAGYYKRGAIEHRAMDRLRLDRPSLTDGDLERLERAAGLGVLRGELRQALADLSTEQQSALQLRIVDGLSYPEVATRMGVNEPTARARVSRGLRALNDSLDRNVADFDMGQWA